MFRMWRFIKTILVFTLISIQLYIFYVNISAKYKLTYINSEDSNEQTGLGSQKNLHHTKTVRQAGLDPGQPIVQGQIGLNSSQKLLPRQTGIKNITVRNDTFDERLVKTQTPHEIPKLPNIILGDLNICEGSVKFMIYVHSAIDNIQRRKNLRKTWASKSLFKDKFSRLIFVFGVPINYTNSQKQVVSEESAIYGDILQGDFLDTYYNLTVKGIFAINFITTYCKHADYIIKSDDDTFLDIFRILDIVEANRDKPHLVICPLWHTMKILRPREDCYKWCIPPDEFPGQKSYPPYCAGLFYLASYSVISEMQKASKVTPYFRIDDVYITGLLMGKANLKLGIKYVNVLKHTQVDDVGFEARRLLDNKYISAISNKERFARIWNSTIHELTLNKTELLNKQV